jgi:hypothetical protein
MGGAAVASSVRVRIKGRKLSVIRFLIISVSAAVCMVLPPVAAAAWTTVGQLR